MDIKKAFILVAAASTAGFSLRMANAAPVSLDTFSGSGWEVKRTLVGPESDSGGTSFAGVTEVVNRPGAWTTAGMNLDSRWVSWLDAATPDGNAYNGDFNGTSYCYKKVFDVDTDINGPAAFSLSGIMAFDNYVTSVTLYDVTTSTSILVSLTPVSTYPVTPGNPTELGYVYELSAGASLASFTSPNRFVLVVNGVNSYADAYNLEHHTLPGPTGFIFSGTASATPLGGGGDPRPVPLPASVGVGFSMLIGFGSMFAARKHVSRKPRIVV